MTNTKRIAVIPGDGIGKEVTPPTLQALEAACAAGGKQLAFTHFDWGPVYITEFWPGAEEATVETAGA